jgi:hypothetical protein
VRARMASKGWEGFARGRPSILKLLRTTRSALHLAAVRAYEQAERMIKQV